MRATPCFFLIGLLLAGPLAADPIFPNSVVSNDIDFIRSDDRTMYGCARYRSVDEREMPDKRGGDLFGRAHVIALAFRDGTDVDLWISTALGKGEAISYAEKLGPALGRLPTLMRREIGHVVVHEGDETAFEERDGGFFVMYSRNIDKRLSTRDLEETIFHESMHVALQNEFLPTRAWRRATTVDDDFITEYAATDEGEDFAESGLFAYTFLRHPERLPPSVRNATAEIMGARLAFFEKVFPTKGQEIVRVGDYVGCS